MPNTPRRSSGPPERRDAEPVSWSRRLADPRSVVLLTMSSLIVIGGGRRLLIARRARKAIDKLQVDDPSPEDIAAAVEFGRDGLVDFFRILGSSESKSSREAAGRAVARLWRRNDLVAEEEKALIRRGIQIDWIGRRKYPRALAHPIELRVKLAIPFLDRPDEASADSLPNLDSFQWRHRIQGTRRALYEATSAWSSLSETMEIPVAISPRDFESNGPHRLVFESAIRTLKQRQDWEFELPHLPFSFEFDPRLDLEAIYAGRDDERERRFGQIVRLVEPSGGSTVFRAISPDFALRKPPVVALTGPPPCDLAHRVEIEIEGSEARIHGGRFVSTEREKVPLDEEWSRLPTNPIERPGQLRMRARLHPDVELAWAIPEVRSLWPGAITTDWTTVEVVRR